MQVTRELCHLERVYAWNFLKFNVPNRVLSSTEAAVAASAAIVVND